ncbi:MAG TPA: hypothetical protein VNO30_34835 [Kofleriaceae bacterium]|nr:hypothetical protein [Kofleriaceae bacterium]
MSIWSTIKEWCNKPATPCTLRWIEKNNVRPTYEEVPIKADETYIRISLVEMVLGQSRAWFKNIQPAVQALTQCKFADQLVELPSLAAADGGNYAPDRSVLSNYRLLDLVPFRGNSIELTAALLAVPGDDKLANGIKALSNVASLLSAPLAGALALAGKLRESAEVLVGGDDAQVHLAYHNTFTAQPGANQARCGYLAIVGAAPAALGDAVLVVDNDQLRIWANNAPRPVGSDYLLLRFEVLANRDDMRNFSDLATKRAAAIDAFLNHGDEAGDRAYRTALAAILSHPELTNADRRVLAQELKTECDALRGNPNNAIMIEPLSWEKFVERLPPGTDHAAAQIEEFL